MSTYVLVHGGGHGGWCFGPLAKLLRAEGHEVLTPTMTGLGERRHLLSPKVNLTLHIQDILNVLQFEDLRDVILLGHSYGGTVITGIADKAADRIKHLVYLDAPVPQDGLCLAEVVGEAMYGARPLGRIVDGVELVMWPGEHPRTFHGVEDPAQQAWMRERLTPHPWACFEEKLQLRDPAAIARIPQTYITCSARMMAMAQEAIKKAADGRLHATECGHDIMIIDPDYVARVLLAI